MSQYAIVIEGDGLSNYSAYAPDLPGVAATGDTLDEAEAAMRYRRPRATSRSSPSPA